MKIFDSESALLCFITCAVIRSQANLSSPPSTRTTMSETTTLIISSESTTQPSETSDFTFTTEEVTSSSQRNHITHETFGENILEYSDIVLSAPITKEFLSRFTNGLQLRILQEQLQFCPYRPLCNFTWPTSFQIQGSYVYCCDGCSCSPDCYEHMNCCPDIIPEQMYNLNQKPAFPQCISKYLKNMGIGAHAYGTCTGDATDELDRNCTRGYVNEGIYLKDMLPVTDENDITYRNIYCARCSHFQPHNLTFWTPSIECNNGSTLFFNSGENIIQKVYSEPYCDIHFYPKQMNTEQDCVVTIYTCNVTGLWTEYDPVMAWACSMYSSSLRSAGDLYFQNVFCMLCNGHTRINTLCSEYNSLIEAGHFSFSAVLKVDDYESESSEITEIDGCPPGSVISLNECVPAHCSVLGKLEGGKCIRTLYSVRSITYILYFRLIPVHNMTTEEAYRLIRQWNWFFYTFIQNTIDGTVQIDTIECFLFTDVSYNSDINSRDLINSSLKFYDFRVLSKVLSYHDPEHILEKVLTKHGQVQFLYTGAIDPAEFTLYLIDDVGTDYDKLGEIGTLQINRNVDFNTGTFVLEDIIELSAVNKEHEPLRLPFLMEGGFITTLPSVQAIKLLTMRNCPFVEISNTENPWVETLYGISFQDTDIFLNFSEFTFNSDHPNTIAVCLDIYSDIQKATAEKSDDLPQQLSVESIVSIVCVSLSILSLLVTLVNFCVIPAFSTLPWKNNFCLTLSLLLAQSLYLTGSYGRFIRESTICKVLGIGLHFFLIMSIVWMNICTFHMFRVLTRSKLVPQSSEWRKFFIYIIYSLTLSVVFVLVNVIYSLETTDYTSIGYGEIICYLNSQLMVLYTFGVPLALVVGTNLLMVGIVMIKLRASSDIQKNITNERNLILIFAKLSVITGLTWIFGLIYMFTNIVLFSYVFIILNGSQGVFLMISFLCNRRVLNLYKVRLTGMPSSTGFTQ